MHRLTALLVCVTLWGCGDRPRSAPLLTLSVERLDGTSHSVGRHRIYRTGVLSESGDRDSGGQGASQRVTIDEITDDGVALTFEMSDATGDTYSKQLSLRYGEQTEVELPNQSTLKAKLDASE